MESFSKQIRRLSICIELFVVHGALGYKDKHDKDFRKPSRTSNFIENHTFLFVSITNQKMGMLTAFKYTCVAK